MGITIQATRHAMFAAPQVRATRLMASVAFLVKMISSKAAWNKRSLRKDENKGGIIWYNMIYYYIYIHLYITGTITYLMYPIQSRCLMEFPVNRPVLQRHHPKILKVFTSKDHLGPTRSQGSCTSGAFTKSATFFRAPSKASVERMDKVCMPRWTLPDSHGQPRWERPRWVCLKMGYTPNYSHLVGIDNDH